MTRIALVLAVLQLAGCFRSHPPDQLELTGTDCYGCHTRDYAATTAPVHPDTPQLFTTACASCHRTANWKPALDGLHDEAFIIQRGPHAPVACIDCHELDGGRPSKQGENTNCIQCHPNDARQIAGHVGVTTEASVPYAYLADQPTFCLSCHPSGLADVHPDDLFARRGDHAVPCADCHDRAAGPDAKGANVTCVESGCHHTLSVSDRIGDHEGADYRAARGDGASRSFCRQCHS